MKNWSSNRLRSTAQKASRFTGLALGAAALLLTACSEQLPTYRYRLTVEVDTPEGLRTGSSVIEVRTREGAAFPGPEAASTHSRIRGEAVAVDLGPRGVLFALLTSPGRQTGAGGYAWALLPNRPTSGRDADERRENYRALHAVRGRVELLPDRYPMLVRFRDNSNPATVEELEPRAIGRAYGHGVRLRRITVEITDDEVTRSIESRLPWLAEYTDQGRRLNGRSIVAVRSNDLAEVLGTGAFWQGVSR